jgi:hypothetical protein
MPSDSANWATSFNDANTHTYYDFTTFDMTQTPFYRCAMNYYGNNQSSTVAIKNPFKGNAPTINLPLVQDPIRSVNGGGINRNDYYTNGFSASYHLGYNAGTTSKATAVVVTDNTFDLMDMTNNANPKLLVHMADVKNIYDNKKMPFSKDGYDNKDYQRGFFGIFNGYFQGYLDGVNMRLKGSQSGMDYSKLLGFQTTVCNQYPGSQLCNSIRGTVGGYNINNLPSSTVLQTTLKQYQTQLNNGYIYGNGTSGRNTQDYNALYLQTLSKLYKAVKTQNDTTLKEIQSNLDVFSADDQKVYYQTQQLSSTSYVNIALLILYYILFVVATYFIVYVDTKMDKQGKWLLVLFFLLYPFLVNPICLYLYDAFMYFYALTNVNVYSPGTY